MNNHEILQPLPHYIFPHNHPCIKFPRIFVTGISFHIPSFLVTAALLAALSFQLFACVILCLSMLRPFILALASKLLYILLHSCQYHRIKFLKG